MSRYKLTPGDTGARWATADEIRAAAAGGLRVWLDVGTSHPRTPCRIASNCSGWITAASDTGGIYQAWAGDFRGSPA